MLPAAVGGGRAIAHDCSVDEAVGSNGVWTTRASEKLRLLENGMIAGFSRKTARL